MPLKGNFVRFGGGAGFVLSDFELSRAIQRENEVNPVERQEVDIYNDLCFQIQGGLERKLSKRVSVEASVSYFIYETKIVMARVLKNPSLTGPSRHSDTNDIVFNSIIGKVTLRFR